LSSALCCRNNETHAPIANLPNSAQLEGTHYHSPKLHPGPCSSVGVMQGTDTQTRVINIHFASSVAYEKRKNICLLCVTVCLIGQLDCRCCYFQSFSELFVKFLERESTPQPSPARLPAERMVQEQQQKQHRQTTPTFNPFSTSVLNPTLPSTSAVPVTDFAVKDAWADPFHPLMRPISPARVPVFAPASDRSTDTPPAVSGRDSANSSGRSTPSAPSAILRDLLQH